MSSLLVYSSSYIRTVLFIQIDIIVNTDYSVEKVF